MVDGSSSPALNCRIVLETYRLWQEPWKELLNRALSACLYMACCVPVISSHSCFCVKTGCVCIFRPTLGSHYCPFPRTACLLS